MALLKSKKPKLLRFDVLNRFSGDVQFTAEIDCKSDASQSIKLGLAVSWAIKNKANLTSANLAYADLTSADLTSADLTSANLTSANLTSADLTSADLTSADLTSADLTSANLTSANLAYADLTSANLASANLRSADLTSANLTSANLTSADLTSADLTYANLRSADLTSANLTSANLAYADLRSANLAYADLESVKQDFIAEVIKLPHELEFLKVAIVDGKIDGQTYGGTCACLAGTFAHAKQIKNYKGEAIVNGCTYRADSSSPRERFFLAISPGNTPENNGASKLALEWVNEAIQIRDNILNYKNAVQS